MTRTRLIVALLLCFGLIAAACGGDDDDASDTGSDTASDTGGSDTGDGGTGDDDTGTDTGGSGQPGEADAGLTEALGLPECPVGAGKGAGPTEIVVWHTYVGETEQAHEDLAARFNESQSDYQVRLENLGNYGEAFRAYKDGIATGSLPAIAILEDITVRDVVDSGTVLPAQSCIEADGYDMSDFVPILKSFYAVDGALYPGAFNSSQLLLYYNKDHFRAAGLDPEDPPQTLAEIQAASDMLAAAGIEGVEAPLALAIEGWIVENWRTGAGLEIVSNDNGRAASDEAPTAAFNDETTLTMLTTLDEMNDAGQLSPATDEFGEYLAVGTGTSSMLIQTSTAVTTVVGILGGEVDSLSELAEGTGFEDLAAEFTDLNLDMGVSPLPGIETSGAGQIGGGAWFMTNTGTPEEQAGAWEFIKFINELESQKLMHLKGSYLPAQQAVADDPDVVFAWEENAAGQWLKVAVDQFNELDPDFPGPQIGPYTETRQALREMLEAVILTGAEPSAAIDAAEAEVNEALQAYEEANF
jgi:sn-glycerol 3-phosphate transport system substrate-binding protein